MATLYTIKRKLNKVDEFFISGGKFAPDREKALIFKFRPVLHLQNVQKNVDKTAEIELLNLE